jgi:hypothetical protein
VNPDGTLAPRVAFAQNLIAGRALAADDDFVYWAASTPETDIVRCCASAPCDNPEVMVEAIPSVQALAVEGPFLYFNVFLNSTLGRVIYRVAK